MRIRARVGIVMGGALLAVAGSILSTVPGGLVAGAVRPPSAPVFAGKSALKGRQGKALAVTIRTKANPTATLSVVGSLPPGASFQDNGNGTGTVTDPTPLGGTYSFTIDATNSVATTPQNFTLAVTSRLPLIRHVFVIMLENDGYASTFGSPSVDPYLATTLPSQGALLTNYYAVGHFSNDNYVGFISGQPPNTDNQLDCLASGYVDFPPTAGQDANGIQQGVGCAYPAAVPNLANQLDADGLTWKGYEEDMGNIPTRESATCGHPTVGDADGTAAAVLGDGYAARHNPFVYFHSIIDNTTECNQNVVPLGDTSGNLPAGTPAGVTGLVTDLASVATTPNFSFITPNLCDDGHDYPCVNEASPSTSSQGDINDWLATWVPIIENSPAFKQDGLLEITFDEGEDPTLDTTACCGETPGPAADNGDNGITGPGGGKVGAVLISPFITPGTVVSKTSYNHFSSLASIEDLFGLPHLGEAKTVTTTFDKHVYKQLVDQRGWRPVAVGRSGAVHRQPMSHRFAGALGRVSYRRGGVGEEGPVTVFHR